MISDGRNCEAFVAKLYRAILDAEKLIDGRNIALELYKTIVDRCGIERVQR